MRVKKIKSVENGKVYDISVDEYENYILENGVITHNSGIKYAASSIIFLSKVKEKDGKDIIGNIIRLQAVKSRTTKENKKVNTRLLYESGLERYYGLIELALKYNIFKKVSTRIELPDGTKAFEKSIYKTPEKYFTDKVMEKIENVCKKEFLYGNEDIN